METLTTLPLGSLLQNTDSKPIRFRIPDYQRGYRWRQEHVRALLEDLWEFFESHKNGSAHATFYCLQPLVVAPSADPNADYDIVDGQQRLTTIFLLLRYLMCEEDVAALEKVFTIDYETRDRCHDYLKDIDQTRKDENVDFYRIYEAYEEIKQWFHEKIDSDDKQNFLKMLRNADQNGANVRFIWYELPESDDPVEAFTRINVGKIPLSDEELIRALFLRHPSGGELAESAFQHRFALDWDRIESRLRDPACWAFLSKQPPSESGCIRLVFELCAPEGVLSRTHGLFLYFEEKLRAADQEKLKKTWQEIVTRFETLEEWWLNDEIFHLVGYLSATGQTSLSTLIEEAANYSKPDFKRYLRCNIREALTGKNRPAIRTFLGDLDYSENPGKIRSTLLLFNIATLLRYTKGNERFPFHHYHSNAWDIEHVASQASDRLPKPKEQREWLKLCIRPLQNEKKDENLKLTKDIEAFIADETENSDFDELYRRVSQALGEENAIDDGNRIGNLTLLDASTNRAYKNAPFVVKRTTVLERHMRGEVFFPPCTRDLFLKVFSYTPRDLHRWSPLDSQGHESAINESLKWFFEETEDEVA